MAETLYVYDEIGEWGISASQFVKDLQKLPKSTEEIDLHINSPGGSAFDGLAIYNQLKKYPAKVRVFVDGLAASAASIVAMAGDEIHIAKNAMLMIHKPWTLALGGADEMRQVADLLDKMTDASLVPTYASKTGLDPEKILEMLDAETWLSSDEALALGFVDVVTGDPAAMNKLDLSKFANSYRNIPENLKELVNGKRQLAAGASLSAGDGSGSQEGAQGDQEGSETEPAAENAASVGDCGCAGGNCCDRGLFEARLRLMNLGS